MVGMSYDFNVALDDFESQVRSVYPRVGDGLLDFLVQQKIKNRDVYNGFGIVKNSKIEMLSIDGTHSGDVEDLLETNIPIVVVEPEDTQGDVPEGDSISYKDVERQGNSSFLGGRQRQGISGEYEGDPEKTITWKSKKLFLSSDMRMNRVIF
ncbi:hypothetical protein Ahy_A01g003703 isoform A [Arachis hypogaea]|uniref:Uncharacterized protein n=1 Tax=Arachis hypogaea TaxID=3818 RepID=A0A445EU35_ARAHY|nr:hypothetical protein Ahy_A01g003703 isoform A [Arachis hypogaea]